jgi:long-subunit acyl-CoA synthetase (AMP-forming)
MNDRRRTSGSEVWPIERKRDDLACIIYTSGPAARRAG